MQNEAPRLVETSGETSVVYKNTNLYGNSQPSKSAEARADAFLLKTHTLYLLVSPLLWYGVSRIIRKLPESSFLIAVEEDRQLAKLSEEALPWEISSSPKIDFLHPADGRGVFSLIFKRGIEHFRRVELLTLNGGYRLHSKRYSTLKKTMEEEIQQFWQNKYTLMHMIPLWIKNIFINLAQACTGTQFSHLPDGKPAKNKCVCVIGAGPSMEAHIPFMKKNRSRLFLMAVDTAWAPLYQHDITPDAVVVQEAQFYNLYDFLLTHRIDSDLYADITSYPGVLRLAERNIHFFTGKFADLALFRRMIDHKLLPPEVPPLGSVGSTAVHLALGITDGPVFVAGLDFSFLRGKTHANGTPAHQFKLQHCHRLRPPEMMQSFTAKGIFPVGGREKTTLGDGPVLLPLTTVTLDRYARNFSRFFQDYESIYRLLPAGIPLDINSTDHNGATYLIDQWESLATPVVPDNVPTPTQEKKDSWATQLFLEEERSLLQEIYRGCRSYLEGRRDRESKIQLLSQINDCEYLFLHFPDTGHELRELEPTMIKRLLVSTGHYIRVIETALALTTA